MLIVLAVSSSVKRNSYVKTGAEISRIDVSYDSDGDSTHNVFVKYKVDGKTYENELGFYQAGYKEGKTIEIYYNPVDPNELEGMTGGALVTFFILGPVMILLGVFLFLRGLAR